MYNHTNDVDICGYHKKIIANLQRLESGEIKRLAVFLPPRFGKTLIATLFSAWYLEMNPSADIIYASYSQDRSNDALETVATANSSLIIQEARPIMGRTDDGGSFYPMSVRGFVGGRGANLLVLDDLIQDRLDADSEVAKRQREDWFINGMHSRLYPDGKILLLSSKWESDDINSFILHITEDDNWTVLNFPAISDEQSIFEKRYPLRRLEAMREKMSVEDWEWLYRQGELVQNSQEDNLSIELAKLAVKNGVSPDELIEQILASHYSRREEA